MWADGGPSGTSVLTSLASGGCRPPVLQGRGSPPFLFPRPPSGLLGGGCPSIQAHPLYLGYQASWPALTMTHFLLLEADNSSPGWSCTGLRMGQMPRTVLCSTPACARCDHCPLRDIGLLIACRVLEFLPSDSFRQSNYHLITCRRQCLRAASRHAVAPMGGHPAGRALGRHHVEGA